MELLLLGIFARISGSFRYFFLRISWHWVAWFPALSKASTSALSDKSMPTRRLLLVATVP